MNSKIFLALSMSITISFSATASQKVVVRLDKQVASIPNDALFHQAELLSHQTLATLNSLKPTAIATPKVIKKNKDAIFCLYMHIKLAEGLHKLVALKEEAFPSTSWQSHKLLILEAASELEQALQDQHQADTKQASAHVKIHKANELQFYKKVLQLLKDRWSSENHDLYIRYYIQKIMDKHATAKLAAAEQFKKTKETA